MPLSIPIRVKAAYKLTWLLNGFFQFIDDADGTAAFFVGDSTGTVFGFFEQRQEIIEILG